jgi:acyl-CoA hydrolase
LTEGAGVVTTRGDIHYVVTEYGIAYLHGKSIRERVMELINIAHPKFRPELIRAAKAQKYIYDPAGRHGDILQADQADG